MKDDDCGIHAVVICSPGRNYYLLQCLGLVLSAVMLEGNACGSDRLVLSLATNNSGNMSRHKDRQVLAASIRLIIGLFSDSSVSYIN